MLKDKIQEYSDYIEPPEPEYKYVCYQCECGIYEGDPVWNINGYTLCDDCAKSEYRQLA